MALTPYKIAHICVLIVYSIAAVVFAIVSLKNINLSSEEAIDMVDNWQQGAILDIAVNETCPPNYEVAFNTTWPGTVAGCYCQNITTANATLYKVKAQNTKKACTNAQLSAGCTNVLPSDKALIDSWGRINNTKQKLCLLRSSENWATQGPISGGDCPENMTKCGSNPQNAYCTKEAKCPINYVSMIKLNASVTAAQLAACVYNSGCVKISDNSGDIRVLRFKRADSYDALPTSEIVINEYSMCTNTNLENTTPNRIKFWLLNGNKRSCNQSGAILWNTLDTRTEYDLYSINDLGPKMDYLSQFGYFGNGTGNSYQWSLFQRSYVPWNVSCRGEMDSLVSRSHGAREMKVAQTVQVVVSAIVNSILGLILPCFMLIDKYPAFTKIFNWVGKLTLLPVQIVCAIIAGSIYTFYTTTIEDYCSTPPIIMILRNFAIASGAALSSNIKGIVSSLLAILFDIGTWAYNWYKRRQAGPGYNEFGNEMPLRGNQAGAGAQQGNRK